MEPKDGQGPCLSRLASPGPGLVSLGFGPGCVLYSMCKVLLSYMSENAECWFVDGSASHFPPARCYYYSY